MNSKIPFHKKKYVGKLLGFFKPASHQQAIQDQELITSKYRYWRFRIFYAMFIGYVFYYFTRKSFTFAMPGMITDLGLDKAQLGLLSSILYITYGVSKFASGVLSDQSNPRYFMAFGLIITGVANLIFGSCSSLILFACLSGINGWFQGWGWPPCARLLTHWYAASERGTWWSVWSTSHNVGGFLIPILAGYCLQQWGWRWAMWIPGGLCIIMGFVLMNRLRDTPQSLGLPRIEEFRGNSKTTTVEHELTTKQILFDYVLRNKWVWMLALSSFFVYVIRMAINDWSALYLIETKGYTPMTSNVCVAVFEVGGLIGMLLAGFCSDKGGKRGPTNLIFAIGMLVALIFFWHYQNQRALIDAALLFIVGFFLFGPQMLIGLTAAELAHKKAAGTASGFAGWFAYFGAAVAGYPLSKVAQTYGWSTYFWVLCSCAVITIILLTPLWNAKPQET